MPGRPRKIPSCCRHKASGQAVVRINGKDEYLGRYGTPESYEKYHRLIAEHFPDGPDSWPAAKLLSSGSDSITVVELIAAYWNFPWCPICVVRGGTLAIPEVTTDDRSSRRPAREFEVASGRRGL